MDAKPAYLAQFAQMGSIYMESVMGIKSPKVALVNVGAEAEKGNQLTKEAFSLLEELDINFIGNIEGRDIPMGLADVIVCDAFTGNVILKHTEGLGLALFNIIKEELMKDTLSKIVHCFQNLHISGLKDVLIILNMQGTYAWLTRFSSKSSWEL